MLSSLIKGSRLFVLLYIILFIRYAFCSEKTNFKIEKRLNPVTYFVDRTEQTKDILQNLLSYKVVSLIGVTNIGKTEIARKYAQLNQKKYGLIWFFDSNLDLNEQFVLLAKKINETLLSKSKNKLSEEAEKAQKETMGFLTERKNWLLVFDNLKLNQNKKLMPIINWKHNGHIITCSQDSKDLPNNIYIHQLDKENAMKLLQKILGTDSANKELFEKLIEIFNGYPGPIVQGALLLKEHKYLSIDEYKNILMKSTDPVKKHMELVLNLLNDNDKKLLRIITVLNNQNFSKNLLKKLFDNYSTSVGEALYNLTQFGLIKNTENIDDNSLFEMHDVIKDGVLELLTEDQIKEVLTNIIKKLNSLMRGGETSRYTFIASDSAIKSNLEVLLENAEKYRLNISDILELRKNLIGYYMFSLDYYTLEKMKKWLGDKEVDGSLDSKKMTNQQKISYSSYLTDIGIYEHLAKSKFVSALSYFSKARSIIKNIEGVTDLDCSVLLEMAQAHAYSGDIINAEKDLEEYDALVEDKKQNIDSKFNKGTYWFIKARVFLSKRQYYDALVAIDNTIKLDSESNLLPIEATFGVYVVKAEILNYMEEFRKSYEIIKNHAERVLASQQPDHELHARILVQLSRAELGLGLIDNSLEHAIIACDIFQKEIIKYNITSVMNPELAAALVAKADALFKKDQFDEALEAYNEAETIYFRIYGNNYRYMDDIAYLLSQGAKAGCVSKKLFWKKHFYDQLIANFSKEHPRVVDATAICAKLES